MENVSRILRGKNNYEPIRIISSYKCKSNLLPSPKTASDARLLHLTIIYTNVLRHRPHTSTCQLFHMNLCAWHIQENFIKFYLIIESSVAYATNAPEIESESILCHAIFRTRFSSIGSYTFYWSCVRDKYSMVFVKFRRHSRNSPPSRPSILILKMLHAGRRCTAYVN